MHCWALPRVSICFKHKYSRIFFFFFGKKLLKAVTSGMLEILQTRSSGKTDDRVIESRQPSHFQGLGHMCYVSVTLYRRNEGTGLLQVMWHREPCAALPEQAPLGLGRGPPVVHGRTGMGPLYRGCSHLCRNQVSSHHS